MSIPQFQTDRREAIRQQLVSMPNPTGADAPRRHQQQVNPKAGKGLGLRIALAGAVVAGAAAAVVALVPEPEDRFEDASRIIESLSGPQQETDKLPAGALPAIEGLGIDPAQTRLLGHGQKLTYYGAPADGDKICMIPVNTQGEGRTVGCTLLKSFESGGLGMETPDQTEEAWLVIPAGVEKALESVQNEEGWTQQAPNFLIRNNH